MKLSIRMKIFLPVMLILIVFPLAFWLVFRYSLDGHMNYNTRRNLERLAEDMNTLIGRFEEEYGDDTACREAGSPRRIRCFWSFAKGSRRKPASTGWCWGSTTGCFIPKTTTTSRRWRFCTRSF